MWHPQSDEAHGEQPIRNVPRWVVPWLYPGLVIVAIVVVGLFLLLRPAEASSERIVAGAIRWPSCEVIEDRAHTSEGIKSVTCEGNRLTIRYTFTASRIVTFIATPDESLALADYRVGASVDRDKAEVTVAGSGPVGEWANVWVYGVFR